MRYPKTQQEFEKWFPDDGQCLKYLTEIRWSKGFICPHCENDTAWLLAENLFKCKKCSKKVSVLSGTLFHGTHTSLNTWFRIIWWFVAQKGGVSATGLKKVLGLGGYQTAWTCLHKLRRVLVVSGRSKLSGNVEVDETYIGGKKSGKRGRGAEGKTPVVIAVEFQDKKTGRVRLQAIPNVKKESIQPFILNNIAAGSNIVTDGWDGYDGISKLGYSHEIEKKMLSLNQEENLPHVHRTASLLKRWILGTHHGGISKKQLEFYLDEFTFRHNRRNSNSRGLLFYRVIEQALAQKPTKYREISKKS